MLLRQILDLLPSLFSAIASVAALFAGHKANKAYKLVKGATPSYHLVSPKGKQRLRFSGLFGASAANAAADAGTVADKIDGVDSGTGQQLVYRKFAFGYEAHPFGLSVDYAFPEGGNVSASMADGVTSLSKLHGRKKTLYDGNQYDDWDMQVLTAKAALRMYPDLMNDEVLSVNYKPPTPAPLPKPPVTGV